MTIDSQIRCVSCVLAFFEMIATFEYPERPRRRLFIRGDIGRADQDFPRFIPDGKSHRFVESATSLTPELVQEPRLPLPFERARAVLAVLRSVAYGPAT